MEYLVIIAAIAAGFFISKAYTKYRGPLFDRVLKQNHDEPKRGTPYKDLKTQALPAGYEIFFMPPLFTVIEDAERQAGQPLNENQFNHAKNNAYAIFIDADEARDWMELNNGRANNFSFADWQQWRAEDASV